MNGGITYWPYTNTCLVETWGNTRYMYIYICLIPSSIPGLYLPHNSVFDPISGSCWYESLLKKDPISKTRLVIKVVFKYPIPGPDSYVQKMIPVEQWFTLLCFDKRIFCVCVCMCVCVCVCVLGKILFMTFPTLIERMKFFFCHTLDICFLWKAFTCPPTKQMCNQFQYHVPLLILQQQVVTNKQTKGKVFVTSLYLSAQLRKW
jgi:hypothetical protein